MWLMSSSMGQSTANSSAGSCPTPRRSSIREEILVPDEIARNYVWLYRQKRSAWTFEMDLRPWAETW